MFAASVFIAMVKIFLCISFDLQKETTKKKKKKEKKKKKKKERTVLQ